MKKNIIPILLALFIGFFYGRFLLNQYGEKETLSSVFHPTKTVYFLQAGAFTSKENMEESFKDYSYYIYSEKEGVYYVYLGITAKPENLQKLKGYFKDIGYDIYGKEFSLSKDGFLEILSQYDALLQGTEDSKTMEAICNQVLAKYEELVLTE